MTRQISVGTSAAANIMPLSVVHCRFVQRVSRRYGEQLRLLAPGEPHQASILQTINALLMSGESLANALRITRQLVVQRLASLDCDHGAALPVVTSGMTELAQVTLDLAVQAACAELDTLHGQPVTASGARAQLWVVGMGKLGARELNVSSDIDLIYVYDHDGETAGQGRISNHEYFCRAVKLIHGLIGDVTEHGFVFRVDLALRPNGNSGPPAVSLAMLEEYFSVQGREWERFAWLKSRVVAPQSAMLGSSAAHPAQALRSVVLPFVFRRYLDYNVFDALRTLHRQIREQAMRRSAGRPERANDVKLARGGIREIEFTVQLLQVVRGGQFPELRTRPTLSALKRLSHAGLMPLATAQALASAYEFLRRVEHRIQYLDDQQTHVLPTDDADLSWMAHSMGLADSFVLLHQLHMHRELVAQEFDTLLGGAQDQDKDRDDSTNASVNTTSASSAQGSDSVWGSLSSPLATEVTTEPAALASPRADAVPTLANTLGSVPEAFAQRVQALRTQPRVLALREDSRARLMRLLQRTVQWLQEGRVSVQAAMRSTEWLEPMLRRESYLALLAERPQVHERLLRILGSARWPARYLLQHPGVIDELANPDMLSERFDASAFETELEHRRTSLAKTREDDDEVLLNVLRRAHHAEVFRTLARDLEGKLTVEQVADDLSALADTALGITARWCWQRLKSRHREIDLPERFAIIGYGKLGGKELGYGSDLDLVFLFDDMDERASEVYATLVRKLINWLTVKTGEGDLFEIDTALRPNGNSGLLVTTFDAYANYQHQRGSNTAWTWEHQAMTRARCVLGSTALRARFEAVRHAVITSTRNATALKEEIHAMRDKVRSAHPVKPDVFDVKHSPGGMVDAEFAVQHLVLSQSAQHPELKDNVGNIALLQRAQRCGLLPEPLGEQAASAYRSLRHMQHQARLNEEPTQVAPAVAQEQRDAVLAVWQTVFDSL